MFWYNVISHNSSYNFKMYISEITKKNKIKSITSIPTPMEQLQKPIGFCCLPIKMGKLATYTSSHFCPHFSFASIL